MTTVVLDAGGLPDSEDTVAIAFRGWMKSTLIHMREVGRFESLPADQFMVGAGGPGPQPGLNLWWRSEIFNLRIKGLVTLSLPTIL